MPKTVCRSLAQSKWVEHGARGPEESRRPKGGVPVTVRWDSRAQANLDNSNRHTSECRRAQI